MFYLHYNPKLKDCCYLKTIQTKFRFTENLEEANKLMVIGGDGTLLHALRKHKNVNIPIYAINYGLKGILMLLPKTTNFQDLHFIKVKRLNSTLGLFLNEIVFGNVFGSLNEFAIYINDVLFKTVRCDSVIIATNSGSTGYSLSANGPYIFDGIVVSCLAIQSVFKTMVLPLSYRIRIVGSGNYVAMVDGVDKHHVNEVEVFYDGNELEFASLYDEFGTKKDQFDRVFNGKK